MKSKIPQFVESAGKRKRSKTTKGDRWLRRALAEAAWTATHTNDT
jgi:hypothetical protein